MELLEEVRLRLRIKSDKFDEGEIIPLIQAAKADLARVGVQAEESDPLLRQAVVLYCKANYGFGDDSTKFQLAYNGLRDSMALSGDYAGGG